MLTKAEQIDKAVAKQGGRGTIAQSYTYAVKFFHEGDDPLQFLLGWEQEAAHLWMRMSRSPELRNARGGVNHFQFATALNDATSSKRTVRTVRRMFLNPAWQAYLGYLKAHTRDAVLDELKRDAFGVVDDYQWARKRSRAVDDYKETRVAAADHLDRIGATEKPQPTAQIAVVTLRGRNFTAEDLDKPSPEIVLLPEPEPEKPE